jgi:hypothetical protein
MKKIMVLGIALVIVIIPALSAESPQKNKLIDIPQKDRSVGKALIAAGCAIFACSMILTLTDQKRGYGHFQGYEVTYKDYRTHYLIADAVGVALFSVGAVLNFDKTKKLRVNAKVKKKEARVQLTLSF